MQWCGQSETSRGGPRGVHAGAGVGSEGGMGPPNNRIEEQ